MPGNKLIAAVTLVLQMLIETTSGQTALKMPELLTRAEKRITVNCLLSGTGYQMPRPWIVFSDRDKEADRFGARFYVLEERETELHVFKAKSCNGRKLVSAQDMGWMRKSELLVSLGADFTENSLIHKKCVILNHHKTIERIKRGEISESEVPLYKSPYDLNSSDHVPLYLIYFVYKIENNRYLLGKDYRFDPDLPFSDQIIGWVDRDRVFDYNNRICFEPAFEESAVVQRRCHPEYAAKVFEFQSELERFLEGDTTRKPIWTEPDYYFFRNPEYRADRPGNAVPIDMPEKQYDASLQKKLCGFEGNLAKIRESKILTGRPLPGNKFRFPMIRMENLPGNVFITGVTGRFENDIKKRSALCQALKENKSQVAIYFVLDNSIDRNRLSYVIGQIQQDYTDFRKKFGVCFFPRPQLGQFKLSIGEKGPVSGQGNYQHVRDFVLNYRHEKRFEAKSDHVLNTLKFVLENESFDSRQTNIIVMVNNHPLAVPDTGLAGMRRDIQDKIVEKNCYLLAFDYTGDNNLVQQIQEISVAAGRQYAERLNMSSKGIVYVKTDIGYEMKNAGLLSVIERADSGQLAAVQMQSFLQKGYAGIISTLSSALQQICEQGNPLAGEGGRHEDPFRRALREIPGMDGNVQYIRALEEGYSSMKFELPSGDYHQDIWKANVLMTKPELEALGSLLDKMLVQTTNSSFSKAVYDLWIALFNRFVGDNLSTAELLPLTPRVIMNRILGEACGYAVDDPVKRYPLERILANDQEIQSFYDGYKIKLTSSGNRIREILATGSLRFSLAEDAEGTNQGTSKKGVYYYWVPMDMLP